MKILTKYIGKTILSYILLVVLFLFGLQIFIEFIREFPNLGVGNYGVIQLLTYVALMLPYDIYQFFPIASLLGAVIGLGLLASHSELIVMRASGVSLVGIAVAVVKAAMILLIMAIILGEVLSPMAVRKAMKIKTLAMSGGSTMLTRQGAWLYNNNHIINIQTISSSRELRDITYYQIGKDRKLQQVGSAEVGLYQDGAWVLPRVTETILGDQRTDSFQVLDKKISLNFNPKLLGVGHIDTDQKNIFALNDFINYRKHSGLDAASYLFIFWQRIFEPLTTLVMILLAVPFVFGTSRSSTMGLRMLLGVVIGFIFYIIHQFVGSISIVYHIDPVIAAISPLMIFVSFGIILLFKLG